MPNAVFILVAGNEHYLLQRDARHIQKGNAGSSGRVRTDKFPFMLSFGLMSRTVTRSNLHPVVNLAILACPFNPFVKMLLRESGRIPSVPL